VVLIASGALKGMGLMNHANITDISTYLRTYGPSLSERVLQQFPALHTPEDEPWPALARLKRRPFPAQTLAIMGIAKRWQESRSAAAIVTFGKSWPKRPHFGLLSSGHFMV
jgi:hypothetical protein